MDWSDLVDLEVGFIHWIFKTSMIRY